jgi:PAS domain S-box-containing protein
MPKAGQQHGPALSPTPSAGPPDARRERGRGQTWSTVWLGLLGLAAMIGCHPLTWGRPIPALWSPAAGVGLALIGWFGFRATLLVFLATLLTHLLHLLVVFGFAPQQWPDRWPLMMVLDAGLSAGALHLAWWCYNGLGRGGRELSDPKSAMLYLLLVPGVVMAGLAALWAGALTFSAVQSPLSFETLLAQYWLQGALGVLILTPPLLSVVTPWLVRNRWAVPEVIDERLVAHSGHLDSARLTRGDWIEILGLAFGASVLAVLLFWIYERKEGGGWQLWGLPLLVIVWASMRQGVRGGTFVAGASAALPLLILLGEANDPQLRILQGNLLAQCSTALLVSASANWIKASELRYRQVVSHSPVLIYSGRILEGAVCDDKENIHSVLPTHSDEPTTVVDPRLKSRARDGRRLPIPISAEITLVSSASVGLMGCAPEQLLGEHRRWLERVFAEDREVVKAALVQLTRQQQPVTCEYRLAEALPLSPDRIASTLRPVVEISGGPRTPPPNRLRWVRDTLAPHFDAEGRLVGWEGVVTEITEQRYLADDLRRTTNMFQTLVSNLPTGVFFVQGQLGRPILVNARARQLLGQREDMSASLEHLSEAYRLFRKDGTVYPVEELPVYLALRHGQATMRDDVVVHRPDGRRIPLVTWGAPVTLGRGDEPDAAVWVLEDLTALHQAEAARRDSEGRLRAVIETMGEGLIVQDRRGCVVDCNPAACSLLMHQPETLRGQSLFNLGWLWLQEDGAPLREEDHPTQSVLRVGRPVRNVMLGLQFPGKPGVEGRVTRWLLVNAMPLGAPAPSGVVTTFSDVSAYRHAQEVVRTSEEKYRGLIESLPLMVLQTDANQRVIYSNPATRSTTGYEEAVLGQASFWETFLAADDLVRFRGLLTQALAGQPGRAELRYQAADGAERVAYALTQPLRAPTAGETMASQASDPNIEEGKTILDPPTHEAGVFKGVTILMVDITRERRLEQDLQRAQRLETIGRLSSGIAHDFNNLLAVVMGLTDLVRASLPKGHQAHADLLHITEASEQAAGLASQLLALSRTRQSATRRIEVNEVARRTLEMLRPTLPTGVRLEAQLSDECLFILADDTQLQQVLMNLCLNARDAIVGGVKGQQGSSGPVQGAGLTANGDGEIRVQIEVVSRVESSVKVARPAETGNPLSLAVEGGGMEGRWVHLSVEDTGHGMTEQIKARIFDPFFSTKEHGTGLGLSVVQQIVESCSGHLHVSSHVGRGTRFEVWLPLAADS